jgi:protease I
MECLAMLRVAILVTDGFEQAELTEPRKALEEARAQTMIVSPNAGAIRGWRVGEWGDRFPVDLALEQGMRTDFGALVLPGGVMNPDKLRNIPRAIQFVKSFFDTNKPVAAICHGPWMVIEAGAARGRRIAAWPSLRTDLKNAGAHWVDQDVAVDGQLVTSRKPEDIPAFIREMIKVFAAHAADGRLPLTKWNHAG